MAHIYEYSLAQLSELENDKDLLLSKFDNEVAWNLGFFARSLALEKYPDKPVVLDISTVNNHILFHSTTKSGTNLDNDIWIERKKKTVQRFGTSSFYVGQKLRHKDKSMEEAMFMSSFDYASHGGCVPLRVKRCDHLVGTLTVSGLAQEDDHLLALEIIREFNNNL